MHHHDDIGTSTKSLGVARFLITSVAEILVMAKGSQAEIGGSFRCQIGTRVIDDDDLVNDFARYFCDSFRQSFGGVVRGHYDYDLFSVDHLRSNSYLKPRL